jgi:RHS repeat-associated protein
LIPQTVRLFANNVMVREVPGSASPMTFDWTPAFEGTFVLRATIFMPNGRQASTPNITVRVINGTYSDVQTTFLHTDAAGSPVAATDAAGTRIWTQEYDPFGLRVSPQPAAANNRQWFHGKAVDTETGFSYFGARYYDTLLGRFMSIDPADVKDDDIHSFNRYAFANNNPYRFTDPDGRQSEDIPQTFAQKYLRGDPQGVQLQKAVDESGAQMGAALKSATKEAAPFFIPVGSVTNVTVRGLQAAKAAGATRYGPINPGPLPAAIANTFRSGSYTEKILNESTTLYRVYGGSAGQIGSFWTRTAPSGTLQSTIDLALNPQWGNAATRVAKIRVPAGTTIFEGAAARQGGLVGGGNQVFIPKVDPSWIVP